jgi:hypothetical protein
MMTPFRYITEGGNAIPESIPVAKNDVAAVVDAAKRAIPAALLKRMQADIGSAGYKVESGDIDLMVEAEDVVALFRTQDEKNPVLAGKKALEAYFRGKGIEAKTNGNNVSIGIPYKKAVAQVDVMVIHDASIVAPYHQHGPRGSYKDPDFRGQPIFILMNSIGKALGLKFDAFGAKLMRRDDNTVVARDRDAVAKTLLNPNATGDDLNSVKSIMAALAADPRKEEKLAQARDDAAKGLINLPESVHTKPSAWFRQMKSILVK